MICRNAWRTLLALTLVTTGARAQQLVRVTGLLERVSTPVLCTARVTYRFACTDVFPVSSAVSFSQYVGQIITVEGTEAGGGTCRIVNVRTMDPHPAGTLQWSGTPTPGGRIRFTILGPGISAHALFVGTDKGYFPIDLTLGTLLLTPPIYTVDSGTSGGMVTIDVPVPNSPFLVGHTLYLQSLHSTIGPIGPPFLGNSICITFV